MRRWSAVAFSVAVVAGTAGPAASAAVPAWRLASIPQNEATSNLRDVAAVDARNAWAVGSEGYDPEHEYTTGHPMMLRWNGSKWSRTSLPVVQGKVTFERVAASSAKDVWVKGTQWAQTIDDNTTLMWRFNGRTWTEVPYPPGATPSTLTIRDLSVVDGHAWLVGYRGNTPVFHEWTGGSWVEHQSPAECVGNGFPNFCTINAVKAFAPDDVWAAGHGMWTGHMGPLLFHWNGTDWRVVHIGLNQQQLSLQSLDGLSSQDIWAVGDSDTGAGNVVVRGDGTTWQVVSGLNSPRTPGVAVGANGAPWVVGSYPLASFNTHGPAGWATTPAPAPAGSFSTRYNSIAAVPGTNRMIAVGAADLPGTSPLRLQAVIAEYAAR